MKQNIGNYTLRTKNFFYAIRLEVFTLQRRETRCPCTFTNKLPFCFFGKHSPGSSIVDSNEAIANFALMNIVKARKSNDAASLRIFSKQDISLHFGSTSHYLVMIDWSSMKVSSPPTLQNLTDHELTIQVAHKTSSTRLFLP